MKRLSTLQQFVRPQKNHLWLWLRVKEAKIWAFFWLILAATMSTNLIASSNNLQGGNAQQSQHEAAVAAEKYGGQDWVLQNLAGKKIRLSDYQGQPVLLVFWATWCPYCKKLLPGIAELNTKYASKGLKIIAVNIKEDWKPEVYWRNHGYQFDTVLQGDEVAKIYKINATPGIVFIQPDGKVLGVQSFSDPKHPLLEKFARMFIQQ